MSLATGEDARGHLVHGSLPAYLLQGPGLPCGPSQGRHPPQTQPCKRRAEVGIRKGGPQPLTAPVSIPTPHVATQLPGCEVTLVLGVRGQGRSRSPCFHLAGPGPAWHSSVYSIVHERLHTPCVVFCLMIETTLGGRDRPGNITAILQIRKLRLGGAGQLPQG